jgi:hypothetical protein
MKRARRGFKVNLVTPTVAECPLTMDGCPGQRAFLYVWRDLVSTVHNGQYWPVTRLMGGFWEDRLRGDEMGSRSREQIIAPDG